MAISKFNQEGYPAPTSFEALTNVADAAKPLNGHLSVKIQEASGK